MFGNTGWPSKVLIAGVLIEIVPWAINHLLTLTIAIFITDRACVALFSKERRFLAFHKIRTYTGWW